MRISNLVIGLGEIGMPLFDIISSEFPDARGIDPAKGFKESDCEDVVGVEFLHVCIPGEIPSFIEVVNVYIERFVPEITIIHSTVAVGTTAQIDGDSVFHSPINGKHSNMEEDILKHPKFIGGAGLVNEERVFRVISLFDLCGVEARFVGSSECTELGKILSTTLYGYLIAWEQEVSHICDSLGVSRNEVRRLWCEIDAPDWDPKVKYPGLIGGHCVIPNVRILKGQVDSGMLDWILDSNERYTGDD